MTNREYYKEQILDIACSGAAIAVDKTTEEIAICGYIYGDGAIACEQCLFNLDDREECEEECKEWCASEHIERPKLTKNERLFLSLLSKVWRYMARDRNGRLFIFDQSPLKNSNLGMWDNRTSLAIRVDILIGDSFSIVKWEDEKPWLIEDLKKIPVEE